MEPKRNYNLGIVLTDFVTKFKGTVTEKIEYLNGSISYLLEAECNTGNDVDLKEPVTFWFDSMRLYSTEMQDTELISEPVGLG